jgi:hypothetical protein
LKLAPAQQFDIEQVAEIKPEGMHRQVHHVHRTLRAHRVQADGAAVPDALARWPADARAQFSSDAGFCRPAKFFSHPQS